MPLDKSKPFGECLGGLTHGYPVQDGVIYHPAGHAVDADGNKLAVQKTSAPAPAAGQKVKTEAGPLAAQLKE